MMTPALKNAYRILASAVTPTHIERATVEVEPVVRLKPSKELNALQLELYAALRAVRREAAQR